MHEMELRKAEEGTRNVGREEQHPFLFAGIAGGPGQTLEYFWIWLRLAWTMFTENSVSVGAPGYL